MIGYFTEDALPCDKCGSAPTWYRDYDGTYGICCSNRDCVLNQMEMDDFQDVQSAIGMWTIIVEKNTERKNNNETK